MSLDEREEKLLIDRDAFIADFSLEDKKYDVLRFCNGEDAVYVFGHHGSEWDLLVSVRSTQQIPYDEGVERWLRGEISDNEYANELKERQKRASLNDIIWD